MKYYLLIINMITLIIYGIAMSIIATAIKNKLKHPFKS